MIETKKSSTEFEEIEEFSPKQSMHWENQIRYLVRFASLLVLGLLIVEIGPIYYPDEPNNILPLVLIAFLMMVFLGGIFLGFSQLRWINETRNKSTNLGGFVGFFGLILTLVASLLSLIPADVLSSYNISVLISVLLPLLAIGLVFIIIGAFTEITRIDEPLVYWFRLNIGFISRLFLFTIAGISLTLGFINWELSFGLPLILFCGGYVVGIAVWYGHSYFKSIGTILSTVVALWGLLLTSQLPPSIELLESLIPIGLVFIGVLENVGLWRHEIYNLLIATKNAIVQAIRATIRFIRDTLRSVYLTIVAFLHYTWDHRVDILRAITTITGGILALIGLFPPLEINNNIRILLVIGGLAFLYAAWLYQVNHFIKQSLLAFWVAITQTVRATVRFIRDTLRSVYISVVAFFHYTWDRRIDILRAFTTIVGSLLTLTGLVLWFNYLMSGNTWVFNLEPLLLLIGVVLLYSAWFNQSNNFIKKSLLVVRDVFVQILHAIYNFLVAVKNAIVQAWNAFVQFIKDSYHALVQFLKTYYREVITTVALGFMILGSIASVWLVGNPFDLLFVSFLLIGYILGVAIWYKHSNFRGVTTTLSTGIFLWGLVLLVLVLGSPDELSMGISSVLILIGVIVNGGVWRVELMNALVQTAHTLYNFLIAVKTAIIKAIRAFIKLLVDIKNAIIQVARVTMHIIRDTFHYIWDHRIDILRAIATVVGSILTFIGFLLMSYSWYEASLIANLELLVIVIGFTLLYAAWFYQINHITKRSLLAVRSAIIKTAHDFYNFLIATRKAIVQAIRATVRFIRDTLRSAYLAVLTFLHYTWDHRIDILRAITTITGFILALAGLFPLWAQIGQGIRLILFVSGLTILYIAWLHQVNHFVKQTTIAIYNALVQTARAIKNFFIAVRDAIIQAIRAFFQFLKDTYRAIVQFFQTYYIEIIRYSATCIGVLSFIVGFVTIFQDPFGFLFVVGGLIILYAAWFNQVNRFIIQTLQAIRDAIVHGAQVFLNFLRNVKNAIIQAFNSLISFLSTALTQFGRLVVAIFDSIILILSIILSVSAIFYGIVLILSGLFDPSGEWTKVLLAENLPILGVFIELIAKFVQNMTLFDISRILASEVETLLGAWADQPPIILIILGIPFIAPGVILVIITFLMRDTIKLSNLKDRIKRSDEQ
ncbi:MAG: hypothetical protein JSU57_00475 [Candidatus Heimdallarchaeota archaeon]|nr:MAG: hypothetical protein JSU57_00475 [Candidatus Heimdallarchaeota archaeon]